MKYRAIRDDGRFVSNRSLFYAIFASALSACGTASQPPSDAQNTTDTVDSAVAHDSSIQDALTTPDTDARVTPRDAAVDVPRSDAGPRPSNCTSPPPLPSTAPTLTPGTLTTLNPAGVPFAMGMSVFSQGMAIDPCDPATIYLGVCAFNTDTSVTGVGLYKTTDAGSTWRRLGQLDEPVRIRIDPRNPQHMYVGDGVRGSTMGFWVSQDAGETWTQPTGFMSLGSQFDYAFDVYDVSPDPADFNHVLVTFHSPWGHAWNGDSGVVESFDGGTTWTVHPPHTGQSHGNNIWFLDDSPGTWLLGTQDAGYWRTEDSAANWTQVSSMTSMAHGGGQLYHAHNGTLYIAGVPHPSRSTDGGRTWTQFGPFGYFTSIFGDGTYLYTSQVGGNQFVFAREDDDDNWSNFDDGHHVDGAPFEMAFDAINGILYASSWDAGLLAVKVTH